VLQSYLLETCFITGMGKSERRQQKNTGQTAWWHLTVLQ